MSPLQHYAHGLIDHLGREEAELQRLGVPVQAAGVRLAIVAAIRHLVQIHPEEVALLEGPQPAPGAAIAAMAVVLVARPDAGAA
jgi:hypothetical protein